MTWRLIFALLTTLVMAAIVHIVIVLLIPQYGTRDAWAFLSGRTDLYSFTTLNQPERGSAISEVDPFFSYGVCRFDLNESGLKMDGQLAENFWSASVFDDDGTVVYSLNNRTAIDNKLDLLIVNPLQSLELRELQSDALETSVVIEARIRYGFVIIRIFQPDSSWTAKTKKFLNEIQCKPFEITS